jgi:Tol biopolymer transport system component/DNA-binding winged helix-turn-helix (wHTH) protein
MSSNEPPKRSYRFGEFRLMADDRMLLRDETRIPMPPRVFNLLLILVENSGRLVSKEMLMRQIWADSFVEEGNLNQTVSRLRKILGERPNQNRFIETIPRVGYRFIADVQDVVNEAEPTDQIVEKSETKSYVSGRSRRSRTLPVFVAFAVIAISAFSLWSFLSRTKNTSQTKLPKQTPLQLTDDPAREERPVFTRDGDIRFIRWQGDPPVTFIMSADGTNQHRETSVPGFRTGAWSPDGKKVVFYKEGDDRESVYLADSNGANEIRLPFIAGNMDWSPDSSKIIYQFGREDSDIYLYTLATGKVASVVAFPGFDSDPSFSPDGKSCVFASDRDGNAEIYIQDLDGSNLRRLTSHPAHDEFPTFSPDGTQIAFNSNREEENFDVYLMNADGSGTRRLTNWKSQEEIRPGCWSADGTRILFVSSNSGKGDIYMMETEPFSPTPILADSKRDLHFPMYSPDSKKLLYLSDAEDKSGELHIVDTDTKQDRLLVRTESPETFVRFSPDGNSIVLQNRISDNAEICVISPDGGELRNLTNNPARDINPAWSPDGSEIVFVSNREGNYDVFSLYIMNADGSNQHRIYYSFAISADPSWSPDGKQIVFANDKEDSRTGNFELFLIEPETVNAEKRLTFHRRYDIQPAFSPDGRRIAFASNADGNYEIYLMNADGSGLLRVTRDAGNDASPSWSPDGKRIIFSSDRNGKFAIYELLVD